MNQPTSSSPKESSEDASRKLCPGCRKVRINAEYELCAACSNKLNAGRILPGYTPQPISSPQEDYKQWVKDEVAKASNTGDAVDEILRKFSSEEYDAYYEASDDKSMQAFREAKQAIRSLLLEARKDEVRRMPTLGDPVLQEKALDERIAQIDAQLSDTPKEEKEKL